MLSTTLTTATPTLKLLSSSDIGNVNRGRVLQTLFQQGPQSRVDLARLVNVPRATVSTIVTALMADGTLEEQPPPGRQAAKRAGKPARPVWFADRAGLTGAVSILPGHLQVAVISARGEFLHRVSHDLPTFSSTTSLDAWVLKRACALLGDFREQLCGVGLTVPAWCDPVRGEVFKCTPLPQLEGTRLPRKLSHELGIPCVLEQDARALALGERWFGRCRQSAEFATVQVGVGVGGAIFTDGRLYHGPHGPTVQLGHICVDLNGPKCRCGLSGCFETIASTRWLRAEAARRGLPGSRQTTVARLQNKANKCDQLARDLLNDYADNLAVGLATVVQLLSIPLFVMHGDVVLGGETFRAQIETRLKARTLPLLGTAPSVVFSSLDQDAGLLGATAAVLSKHFGLSL